MSRNQEVQKKFDRLAAGYTGKYERPDHILLLEKQRRLELLLEYAARLQPQSVLDAGCGPGIALAALSGQGAVLHGTDLALQMVHQAAQNTPPDVRLLQSKVEQLPFAGGSFDLVYALGVMDYIPRPAYFFAAVARILRPGGRFIFTFPNAQSLNRSLRSRLRALRGRSGVAAHALSQAQILSLAGGEGFELRHIHYITYGSGLKYWPWSQGLSLGLEKRLGRSAAGRALGWTGFVVLQKKENGR